jgi:hypothetical protein
MKTRKSIKLEMGMYVILILLAIAKKLGVPFMSPLLCLIAIGVSIMYYYAFQHWFKDEKNKLLKVVGYYVMSLIPFSFLFIILVWPFAHFILLFAGILFHVYWIIRFARKSIKMESILQKIWFFCLWLSFGIFAYIVIVIYDLLI